MPLLVRRINRAKWVQIVITAPPVDFRSKVYKWTANLFFNNLDVSADAITNCLKTTNNDLSVWHIETEVDLEKAILALITGKTQEKFSKLDVAIIDEKIAMSKGIEIISTTGDTVVKDLADTHKDLTNLTYSKLGVVKDLIIDCITTERTRFFTKKQLTDLVKKALTDGRINKADLNQKLVEAAKL
jgi:hypothetical protein